MNHQLDPDDYPSEVIDRYQAARAAFIDGETEKAIQLATELAEEGYPFAQHVLGSVYVQSADVEHNPELARKWLTAAADNGFGASIHLLGLMELNGVGCPDLPTLFDHLQTPHAAKCTVQFGFKAGREKLPLAGEDLFGWAKRIAISKEERERQLRLLDRVGHDFELYDLVDRPKDEEIQFIVPGLIPRGMVGLLAGGKEVGKSSLMDELCAKLECNIPGVTPEFLGVPLACGMTTLFLSGEDPGGIFSGRRSILAKTWGEGSGMIIDATTRSFDELSCVDAEHLSAKIINETL